MDKKIEKMSFGGKILGQVLGKVMDYAKPGVSELEIDNLAEKLILEQGGKPGFKKVEGYKHTICVSTNEVVVHGIPTKKILKEGDILGIDCGVFYGGYHTDMAETRRVSTVNNKPRNNRGKQLTIDQRKIDGFLETGKKALFAGIRQAKAGNRVGHISRAIQEIVEGEGFSVVRSLVGHGVGKSLHEEPEIPGYLATKIEKTPLLTSGMTIAVEVIYNMGRPEVVYDRNDDWTIATQDGTLSGLFERTILITEKGPQLLTRLEGEKI